LADLAGVEVLPLPRAANGLRCQPALIGSIDAKRLSAGLPTRSLDRRPALAGTASARSAALAVYDSQDRVAAIVERDGQHLAITNTGKLIGRWASRSAAMTRLPHPTTHPFNEKADDTSSSAKTFEGRPRPGRET
jgi:hypothetical protein